ncbi:MAG TPA: thioesterase family protein [Promineifilum sp.]|nr:thioesterase family protein [Promineifilum sp.]
MTTRWSDNDSYRHISSAVYLSYFDTAVCRYLIEHDVLDVGTSDVVGLVAETNCQYFREIAFPSVVDVGMRIGHQGNSSIRYEIGLFSGGESIACAQGFLIHVYIDRQSRRPVRIPEKLSRAVAPLYAGTTVDTKRTN